jgi:hypothetical protein
MVVPRGPKHVAVENKIKFSLSIDRLKNRVCCGDRNFTLPYIFDTQLDAHYEKIQKRSISGLSYSIITGFGLVIWFSEHL